MCSPSAGRGYPRVVAGRARELHRNTELPHRHAALLDLHDHLARPHQLRLERLVELQDRLQAAVVLRRELEPLGACARAEDPLHLAVDLRAGQLELRRHEILAPDPLAPRAPELRLQRAQRHPAVGALVGAVADEPSGELQLAAPRHRAVGEIAAGDQREPGERAVGHRDVDQLTLAAALALVQRRHDAERRHQRAAAEVRDLPRRLHRRAIALPRQAEHPHESQVVHVVARALALGPVLAVAGDRAVHERRVLLAEALVADAEALQHAGSEGLEQHVVVAREGQQHLPPPLALQVDPDRALVAVERQEERRARALRKLLVVRGRPAHVVAGARVLDLQHLGAEVREQERAEPSREQAREVEHLQPRQRLRAHRGVTPSSARASCTLAGRLPTSSAIARAFAISSPFELAMRPSGR